MREGVVVWLAGAYVVMVAANLHTSKVGWPASGVGAGVGVGVGVAAVNAVLSASPQHNALVIIITHTGSKYGDVEGVRAPGGRALFHVDLPDDGGRGTANDTNTMLSRLIHEARELRKVSWHVTVVVMSDHQELLSSVALWLVKGRLLVWWTRLLVLTTLPLHTLHALRHTLAFTNSLLLHLTHTPTPRVTLYVELPYTLDGTPSLTLAFWTPHTGILRQTHSPFFFNKFMKLPHRPRLVVSRVVVSIERTEVVVDPSHPGGVMVIAHNAENRMMDAVAASVNFTVLYVPPSDGHWGSVNSDGMWTGMIGMVVRKEADIALGLFTITPQRLQAVDFTYPVTISHARILSARPSPEVTLWSFLLPLTSVVWLSILLSLAVYTLVMILPSCLSLRSLNRSRLFNSSCNIIRVLLQQDVLECEGWWWWERVVVGVWMLTTLVLTKSYSGNLMSLLAVRYVPDAFNTLEDLLNSRVTVLFARGTEEENAFKTATSGLKREVWKLREQNRIGFFTSQDFFQTPDMLRRSSNVLINNEVYSKKSMALEFKNKGHCDLSLGHARYVTSLEAIAVNKNNPLVIPLTRKVMQVSEGGLYEHWQRSLFPNTTVCLNPPTKFAVKSALALKNIWGMFLLLGGGWVLSAVLWCLEVCWRVLHRPPRLPAR